MRAMFSRSRGFSLLEAVVALVLVASLGGAVFTWVNSLLLSIEKIEEVSSMNAIRRNTTEFITTFNMMASPQGERQLGRLAVRWNAKLVEPIRDGVGQTGGKTGFTIGLYQVDVQVIDGNASPIQFSLLQVGYESNQADVF